LIQDLVDLRLEPGRVEEKIEEEKTWRVDSVDLADLARPG